MANEVVNRQINIFIQSGEAQKALDVLLKKEKALTEEIEKTTNPKRLKKLKEDFEAIQEPIDRAKRKLSGELTPALRDIETTANNARNALKRLSPGETGYTEAVATYRAANK